MAKTPLVEYIEEDDIGILRLKQGEVARTLERKPCVLVDVDRDGYPLSIEIQGVSKINAADLCGLWTSSSRSLLTPLRLTGLIGASHSPRSISA